MAVMPISDIVVWRVCCMKKSSFVPEMRRGWVSIDQKSPSNIHRTHASTPQIAGYSVLTPLNAVKINAFLHKLPQWAELSQEGNTLLYSLQDIVDLARCRESSDTESDAAVSALVTVSKCAKHVARLQGRRRASTARRKSDVLERHQ